MSENLENIPFNDEEAMVIFDIDSIPNWCLLKRRQKE